MTIINPLQRTVHEVLETDLPWDHAFDRVNVKKVYQYVKYIAHGTLKRKRVYAPDHEGHSFIRSAVFPSTDYNLTHGTWYGYDTVTIRGSKGFIRLALTPLFESI